MFAHLEGTVMSDKEENSSSDGGNHDSNEEVELGEEDSEEEENDGHVNLKAFYEGKVVRCKHDFYNKV